MSDSPKAYFFDAAGTLLAIQPSVGFHYQQRAAHHGIHISHSTLNEGFRQAFQNAPPMCFPKLPANEMVKAEKQWWKNLVSQVFQQIEIPKATFEMFFEDLYAYFATREPWHCFPDVIPALEKLRAKGAYLAVASNFDSRLIEILKQFELYDFFDAVHFSTALGAAKPQPEFFEKIRPQSLHPQECMMIGDQWPLDIEPARQLGFQTYWLQRNPDPQNPPESSHAHRCLADL